MKLTGNFAVLFSASTVLLNGVSPVRSTPSHALADVKQQDLLARDSAFHGAGHTNWKRSPAPLPGYDNKNGYCKNEEEYGKRDGKEYCNKDGREYGNKVGNKDGKEDGKKYRR
ncbi:hypothetical protein K437DRAFT_270335, partial [Tilletiaria anomala UBC 951]